MLVVLVGKSGSGKDTIARELIKNEDFLPMVSTTTRPMREGEVDGVDYNFVSKEVFGNTIMEDGFLEYRKYKTINNGKPDLWFYGTPKAELDEKENYIKIADIDGAKAIVDYYGKENCFVAYVFADDIERQKRAMHRGSFELDEWKRRLDDDAIKFAPARVDEVANYIAINTNDCLEIAVGHMKAAIDAYSLKTKIPNEKYICCLYEEDDKINVRVVNEKDSDREIPRRVERLEQMSKEM